MVYQFAFNAFDSICSVELRQDGMYIWGWKDHGRLEPKERGRSANYELICWKITEDGVQVELGRLMIGQDVSPVLGSAQSAALNKGTGDWFVRDYYMPSSSGGSIKYVQSTIKSNSQMKSLMQYDSIFMQSNFNTSIQGIGLKIGADRAEYLMDGLEENDWTTHDLDSGYNSDQAWSNMIKTNDGTQGTTY